MFAWLAFSKLSKLCFVAFSTPSNICLEVVFHTLEHLLIRSERSAEEVHVGLGDLGIPLLSPLFHQGACIFHMALEQCNRTLKDTLGILEVACLDLGEMFCHCLGSVSVFVLVHHLQCVSCFLLLLSLCHNPL